MNLNSTSRRASVLVTTFVVAASIGAGCVADPPRTIIVTGGGDSSNSSGDGGAGGSGAGDGVGASTATNTTTTGTQGAGAGVTTGPGSGGSQSQGDFGVGVGDDSPSADLMSETTITVTVTPMQGFSGTVTLSAVGLPSEVEADFGDSTLSVTGGSPASTILTLKTDSAVPPGDIDFKVHASGGSMAHDASATLTVNPAITIHIPQGVLNLSDGSPYMTAYGPYPIRIVAPNISSGNPISVRFFNDDDLPHQIHADSPVFPHDPNPIPANSMDPFVRQVPMTGTYDFYLHDQGTQTPGRVVIE